MRLFRRIPTTRAELRKLSLKEQLKLANRYNPKTGKSLLEELTMLPPTAEEQRELTERSNRTFMTASFMLDQILAGHPLHAERRMPDGSDLGRELWFQLLARGFKCPTDDVSYAHPDGSLYTLHPYDTIQVIMSTENPGTANEILNAHLLTAVEMIEQELNARRVEKARQIQEGDKHHDGDD